MLFKANKRFFKNERGGLSVDAVFALPMLVWAITATFVFWDAFKTLNISQKATYTVADMLSREGEVDSNYMTSVHEIFDFLAGDAGANALRVSVVTFLTNETTGNDEVQLVWSEGVNLPSYTNSDVLEDRLPTMSLGEQIIVVETEQEWAPAFAVGLASYRFREVALSRPRFEPNLCWRSGATKTCTPP